MIVIVDLFFFFFFFFNYQLHRLTVLFLYIQLLNVRATVRVVNIPSIVTYISSIIRLSFGSKDYTKRTENCQVYKVSGPD